jgi:TonB family protein
MKGRTALALAMVLSGLLHVGFGWWANRLPAEHRGNNRTAITISFNTPPPQNVSRSDAAPNQNQRTGKQPPPKPRDAPPDPVKPSGQVVKLPPEKSPPPKDARYVSEHDHAVEKETRAKETDPEAAAAHEKKADKGVPPPSEVDRPEDEVKRGAEEPEKVEGQQEPQEQKLLGGNPGINSGGLMGMWRRAEAANQQGHAGASTRESDLANDDDDPRPSGTLTRGPMAGSTQLPSGPVNLNLDDATLSKIAGGAPANDALEEVEPGTGTYLNARQWRYASYFNRISEMVRKNWKPEAVLRRRRHPDLDGRVRRRFTLVEITLDHNGRVTVAQVDRYSGSDELDDEATRAVRAAGPFPNPPEPLFEGHETFSFKFGFTVEFEQERSVVPFRYGVPTR